VQSLREGPGRYGRIESDPNYSGRDSTHLCSSEQPERADEDERPKAMSLAAICAPVPRWLASKRIIREAMVLDALCRQKVCLGERTKVLPVGVFIA
jgi:hypothetical protein